ncbi:MAG: divergent polysaccharide deacetylase family protein [Gammaproteobacteria bacterium]
MKTDGINRKILKKRQQCIAVVFLFGLFNVNQTVNAIEYKTQSKTTSQINYSSDDTIKIKKIDSDESATFESEPSSAVGIDPAVQPVTETLKPKIKVIRPAVSIIIDDLGDRLKDGMRAVSLPAPYTYSFLPNTPFAKRLAIAANSMNKEVMLHIPMQATNGKKLGPNGLTSDMSREVFDKTLLDAFNSIPHVRGVNNHMGSLLTANKQNMSWVMNIVAHQGNELYFVDSRTTAKSVIVQAAKENNINVLSRDTFIDFDTSKESISRQIQYLIKIAKKNGSAIGIAHPYPTTLEVLEIAWPIFYEQGVDLIPVSELITLKKQRELSEWRLSSSR